MCQYIKTNLIFSTGLILFFICSCQSNHPATEPEIVSTPEEMNENVSENVKEVLQYALQNNGNINDTIKLQLPWILHTFYKEIGYKNIWSNTEVWEPIADSLYNFIESSEAYGLFPADYHFWYIKKLKEQLATDSSAKTDATIWTKAELMLTDAFMQISKHLKQGRLLPDSISLSADSTLANEFFIKNLKTAIENRSVIPLFTTLEPKHKGYTELKKGIRSFIDSMDRNVYTYLNYPNKDSMGFIKKLKKRFIEGGYLTGNAIENDSLQIAAAIKSYQKKKGLKTDGKISSSVVRSLNSTDNDRFKKIAINIDRFKQLPAKFPQKYIWVNLPSYYLQLIENDSIIIQSKTIIGKPVTRTPTLNSAISDMITYPQWTIPNSIIKKEILPALKNDAGYLTRKGYNLIDLKGEVVDPYSINWEKYTKGIPYKIVQGSGDDNALGILKFNFNNPYSVYLHDTNQRYLFKNSSRALSHGCVRVQEWEKLAYYIARNDSLYQTAGAAPKYNVDSIKTWLANKERRRIVVKNRIPLYIRYFTCEGKNGKVVFYDDIYGEDKVLRQKYFAGR